MVTYLNDPARLGEMGGGRPPLQSWLTEVGSTEPLTQAADPPIAPHPSCYAAFRAFAP